MSHQDLSSFLTPYKEQEDQYVYTSSILIEDRSAHKLISAWTTMPVTWDHPQEDPPEDQRERWDWLWSGVEINWETLGQRAGIQFARTKLLFEPLRANRLVYPDGTAAQHALSVLKAEVVKGLKKSPSKRG